MTLRMSWAIQLEGQALNNEECMARQATPSVRPMPRQRMTECDLVRDWRPLARSILTIITAAAADQGPLDSLWRRLFYAIAACIPVDNWST
jgi:hypothetical protein